VFVPASCLWLVCVHVCVSVCLCVCVSVCLCEVLTAALLPACGAHIGAVAARAHWVRRCVGAVRTRRTRGTGVAWRIPLGHAARPLTLRPLCLLCAPPVLCLPRAAAPLLGLWGAGAGVGNFLCITYSQALARVGPPCREQCWCGEPARGGPVCAARPSRAACCRSRAALARLALRAGMGGASGLLHQGRVLFTCCACVHRLSVLAPRRLRPAQQQRRAFCIVCQRSGCHAQDAALFRATRLHRA
jgi:hypothetical protein